MEATKYIQISTLLILFSSIFLIKNQIKNIEFSFSSKFSSKSNFFKNLAEKKRKNLRISNLVKNGYSHLDEKWALKIHEKFDNFTGIHSNDTSKVPEIFVERSRPESENFVCNDYELKDFILEQNRQNRKNSLQGGPR